MIILRIEGGLGNIMFEYAFGRRMARVNDAPLKFDVDTCKINPLGDYSLSLEAFNIDITHNLATREEIDHFKKFQTISSKKALLHNLLVADPKKYVKEKHYHFDQSVLDMRGDMYLHGWWQSEKYFRDIRPILLEDFSLRVPLSGENTKIVEAMRTSESVAVHIRRLDYVKNPKTRHYHGELPKAYYDQAFSLIAKEKRIEKLFVFSDDIRWTREHMRFPFETVYIEGNLNAPHEDMTLMSYTKHAVTANSSFSWWGAWLNQNPEKIVVSPTPWVAETSKQDSRDVVPENWHTIPANYIRS